MDPQPPTSPRVKPKSTLQEALTSNLKTSITCTNVPDELFNSAAAKKHFSKFGKVQKITLCPKRQMCIVIYDMPASVDRALLNAGAFDGFMFDVTRTKSRMRRRSSRIEDDPDWVPDSDVEEELSAMGGAPTYRLTRQKTMDVQSSPPASSPAKHKVVPRPVKQMPVKKKIPVPDKKPVVIQQAVQITEPPIVLNTQTTLSTAEAAVELHQLRNKVSLTPDDQWRILDARDRILRAWGGAGSRIKAGGATIGTCQDMCPEKELLHRKAEHQVMTLETVLDSDGELEPWRAVKQYSRSSADQEIPMCYELRPASALMRTVGYLLHEIADTKRQVSLADWFHFMWDRFRGIRKDITQQALCCAESIRLVEMCARFHAHCAARLADLEHTQFDQKLNTDNLTKCLQTLKHMYADVDGSKKPREAEFRGYIALLNLGDANFWWEIKQLPQEIQKSSPIAFAIKVFNALDNNNYVRFFRLVKVEATYLQACILLRYFNDVRARALARIVKAYAPRGGSRFPAEDMFMSLGFESVESLKSFINHYGLRFARTEDSELSIILDRKKFIEDSDPYPTARAITLIESKRNCSVGEIIAGGDLPKADYSRVLYTSFSPDGRLKEAALTAAEQGYDTRNDSNKDIQSLKSEIQHLAQGGKILMSERAQETKPNPFIKPDPKTSSPRSTQKLNSMSVPASGSKLFSFKPAIPVAPTEIINNSPEKIFSPENKNIFSFSKPQETEVPNLFTGKDTVKNLFEVTRPQDSSNVFSKTSTDKGPSNSLFTNSKPNDNVFQKPEGSSLFSQPKETKPINLFSMPKSVFGDKEEISTNNEGVFTNKNIFSSAKINLFSKPEDANATKIETGGNIFGKKLSPDANDQKGSNIFGTVNKSSESVNIFSKTVPETIKVFAKSEPESSTLFTKTGQESNNIFSKPNADKPNIFDRGGLFSKPTTDQPGLFTKPSADKSNLLSKPENSGNLFKAPSIFANGVASTDKTSPKSLFKTALNDQNGTDDKGYSIFQSKNKAQTVADNIMNSVTSAQSTVYEFNPNEELKLEELQRRNEERIKEEERILEEKVRREEEERKEEMRRQEEEKRKEELRRQEERRKEESRRKQEELRIQEEKRRKEEQRKQEELKKRLEEERQAELKQKAEEERKFKERVDKESFVLVEELTDELKNETVKSIMKEELEKFNNLMKLADTVTDELLTDLCNETCVAEMKAEIFLTQKLMKKWFNFWRKQYIRNVKRRRLLEDTPIWLTHKTPIEEAFNLKRLVENSALKNMNAIHRGYKFCGELKQLPTPEAFNIMEIIRSPLLKRMKQIHYPYDKCFFWKLTLVTPSAATWLCRKINIEKWLLDVYADRKKHDVSETLIQVGKHSWNHLMDFAISVSLAVTDNQITISEAMEGSNAILFYANENEDRLVEIIGDTLKHKYPYQVLPVGVIMPKMEDSSIQIRLESILADLVQRNIILAYRIFVIDSQNCFQSLCSNSKSAIKWLAKKFPPTPPLEIDHLKSICQRYLGNEIWYRFKSESDIRMNVIVKDIYKLIKCYNTAVDNLTNTITNEDLFNYPSFALEFQQYLNIASPYPKPYEFIPSSVKNSENVSAIRRIMNQLRLPVPSTDFKPVKALSTKQQITNYCNQLGWYESPEELVCKVVAVLPSELSNISMPREDFTEYFSQYNLVDFMNIIVYEKINRLKNFDNRFAIYEKSALADYRSIIWVHETSVMNEIKHKALDYEDEVDFYIDAKRRKIEIDSLEMLMLEDKDCTLVDESIKVTDENISKINDCAEAVKQLEQQLEDGKKKSLEFENLLKAALADL